MTQADWEEIDEQFQEGVTFGRSSLRVSVGACTRCRPRRGRTCSPDRRGRAPAVWRLTRPRFERLQRRAFRHAA